MDTLLIIVLVSLGIGCMAFAISQKYDNGFGRKRYPHWWSTVATLVAIACGIVFVVTGFIAVIIYPSRAVGRTTCHNFAKNTGYTTKFVILNWSDTGTCLAQAPDGRWVKNSELYIQTPSKP